MSDKTTIEWTDYTFNGWRGCTKVSPGCANCYAETLSKRNPHALGQWGPGRPRVLGTDSYWRRPLKWNREAKNFPALCIRCGSRFRDADKLAIPYACPSCDGLLTYQRPRVFTASLADWLDDDGVPTEWRVNLLQLIHATPNLDWQLLTKRPQNWERLMDAALMFAGAQMDDEKESHQAFYDWLNFWVNAHVVPDNVWLGVTVEDQTRAEERIPVFLRIPAKVRFLSCEPLLGPLDLPAAIEKGLFYKPDGTKNAWSQPGRPLINWVICGGESGRNARSMHPDWARGIRDQCATAGAPFFFKQWGEWAPDSGEGTKGQWHAFRDGSMMRRVGKKAAGRLLDGVVHSAFPL